MAQLKRNQFKDDSIDTAQIEDLQIVDADISETAEIQQSKIQNLESDLAAKVNDIGDTMTGFLTLSRHAIDPTEIATKQYAEDAIPSSLSVQANYPYILVQPDRAKVNRHYIIHNDGTAQQSSVNTDVIFSAANIEGSASPTPNTHYYLYATKTGFIWSTTAPNRYKIHPTNDWIYLAWTKTNGSNALLRLRKQGQIVLFVDRVVLFSASGATTKQPVDVSPYLPSFTDLQVHITLYYGMGGTTSGNVDFYVNSTDTTPAATIPYRSWNGSQAGYTYNNPRTVMPLDSNRKFYYTKVDSIGNTCYLNGYMEN